MFFYLLGKINIVDDLITNVKLYGEIAFII